MYHGQAKQCLCYMACVPQPMLDGPCSTAQPDIELINVQANIEPSQAGVIYMLSESQIKLAQQELSRGSESSNWDTGGDQ